MKFLKDVISELKKITWLSKSELFKTTGIVLLFTLVISIYVFGVDTVTAGLYGLVMKNI